MEVTFTKIERLCSKKAIDDLFSTGKSKTQFPIKLIYKLTTFESHFPVRAMFVVPKKKHKRANKRNTLKRRMREAYRLHKHLLYHSLQHHKLDVMFVFLSDEAFEYQAIEKSMLELIHFLIEKNKPTVTE